MALTTDDLDVLVRLLREHPESRTQLRMALLLDDFQALPERFDRLTDVVEQLAEAQQRTEERLEQLAHAQQRTEERLERLETTVQALAEAQQRTEERLEQLAQAQQRTEASLDRLSEEVQELVKWQRGEAGRREGERYKQLIGKRAPALFNGGEGGPTDRPPIQQRLVALLKPLPALDALTDEENPFLADLIWWKDDHFLVVEASLKVNGNDVLRAARRAETLRRANVQATGLVVGEEWLVEDTRRQAKARDIDWKVGDDLSEGLLAFRRLSA